MFTDRLPDLRALELIESIARTGSITLAAGELGITQQAVSRRLRHLEQRLDRELVVRSARSSRLTDDGVALLALAQPLLAAAAELDGALDGLLSAPQRLDVAASMTIAEYFLPQWISTYVAEGRDARLLRSRSTNTGEVIRLVSEGKADIGFVEGNEPPRGMPHALLAYDDLAVYVAPGHPGRRCTTSAPGRSPEPRSSPASRAPDAAR